MPNTYDGELMPRIMAGALMVLREACPLAHLVEKDFDGAAAQVGQDVIITRPARVGTSDVVPAATPPAAVDTPVRKSKITLDKWKRADPFSLTTRDSTLLLTRNILPGQIKEQARALANQLSADLLGLYKKVSGLVGTPGTNPFATSVNAAADVRDQLNRQLCPDEGENRHLIIGYDEETAALKLDDFKKFMNVGDTLAFRQGQLRKLYGLSLWRDSQRPMHQAGTGTGYAVNHAEGYNPEATDIAVDSGTGTILEGDIITFAGHTMGYAVKSFSNSVITLHRPNGLTEAVANDEAITVSASHKVNLGLDTRAIGLVMRVPPDEIEGAEAFGSSEVMVDPLTGIPLKLYKLPGYHMAQWELSILYGCELIDDRLATRLAG